MTSEQIDELEKAMLAHHSDPLSSGLWAAWHYRFQNAAPALIAAARENAKLRAVVEAARELRAEAMTSPQGMAPLSPLLAALSALDAKENA